MPALPGAVRLLLAGRGERLIPALSGLLLAASFPPLHLLLPPLVGLAPFVVWVHDRPGGTEGRRSAVRGSLVFGTIYYGVLFNWMLVALVGFTPLAIPSFLAALALLVGVAVLFGWMLHRMVHLLRAPLWVAVPVAWTASEWLRGHWPGSLAFPWLGLGTSLTGFPELVGTAELVGASGIGFWLATTNGLVAGLVLQWRGGGRWIGRALVIAAVLGIPAAWGFWRAGSLAIRDGARVAIVQPNVLERVKLDPVAALDSALASLDRLLPRIQAGSVDLVVLPEAVLPLYAESPAAAGALRRLAADASRIGAPILFGALGREADGSGGLRTFNSAFLVRAGGLDVYRYDKRHLVPIVERAPLLPAAWVAGPEYFGSFAGGEGWPLAEIGGQAFGVLICYESTFPGAARAFRRAGADVLVNITNDAWYGGEPRWARTLALWQHPAHLVMRAIENRSGVVRSANTGISMFVDPVGRVHEATELFQADVKVATVQTTDLVTFYTRHGDLVGAGATVAALLMMLSSFGMGRSLDPPPADV